MNDFHHDLNDEQLLRYSRHILLDEIGIEGQIKLLNSRILIVGAGGLGCPVALYLASSGVGFITLIDNDDVDLSNLQRQIAHNMQSLGRSKVDSLREAITKINPETRLIGMNQRADALLFDSLLPEIDLVLDCTDNFQTRHLINAACVKHRVALISGSALKFDAQIGIFDSRVEESPCYACLFPPETKPVEAQCSSMGVLAPLVGVIGSLQAVLAIQWLIQDLNNQNNQNKLIGFINMFDAKSMEWTKYKVKRNILCPVCAKLSDF